MAVDDQVSSVRLETVDSEAVLQAMEGNPVSRTGRVSGELGTS